MTDITTPTEGDTVQVYRRRPHPDAPEIAGPEEATITGVINAICVDVTVHSGDKALSIDYWNGEGAPPPIGTYAAALPQSGAAADDDDEEDTGATGTRRTLKRGRGR